VICASNQPYFVPYPGFFIKAAMADAFVILDTVQFPRGTTWVSRNRFKSAQGTLWVTVPVWKKGLGLQRIHEVRIAHEGRWAEKHLSSINHAYKNAPYFQDHMPVLEDVLKKQHDRLLDLNLSLIHHVLGYLNIDTKVVLLSELEITARGGALLIEVCRKLGADKYLAQDAAGKYLVNEMFSGAGVGIEFFRPKKPVYPQLWGDFITNLSIFDLLFNCGPKSRDILIPSAR
jgi:hypothetical protein